MGKSKIKYRDGGGITRTVVCKCGFTIKAAVNNMAKRLTLHNKVCDICSKNEEPLGKSIVRGKIEPSNYSYHVEFKKSTGCNNGEINKITKELGMSRK